MIRRGMLAVLLTALMSLGGMLGCGGGGGGGVAKTNAYGFVRDSANADQVVEGAVVQIRNARTTTVNRDQASETLQVGSFRLDNPPVGANTALVTLPGKAPQTIGFRPAIRAGSNGEYTLYVNIGQVGGKVIGTDSKPAVGAFVVVTGENGSAFTTTEANGSFLVEFILPGSVSVVASLGPANVRLETTVGDGLKDVGQLVLVEDDNPDPPMSAPTIVGTVTDASSGAKIGGAAVLLLRNEIQVETTSTDNQGRYEFMRPVGNYRIRVLAPGYLDGEGTAFALTSANTPPNSPFRADFALNIRP